MRTTSPTRARRRQLGTQKSTDPLPSLHPRTSDAKIIRSRLGILATILLWVIYVVYTVIRELLNTSNPGFRFTTEALSYVLIVTFLMFSALMYLISRLGALQQFRDHRRVPRGELDNHFGENHGSLTALVPSYAEEPSVVRATLWSAALQEYPSIRLVLLIDDEPNPRDPAAQAKLAETRSISAEITTALAEPSRRFADALLLCETELDTSGIVTNDAVRRLSAHYAWAARWLEIRAATKTRDHVERFFADEVLGGLAEDFTLIGSALDAATADNMAPTPKRMVELHRRLVWTFTATVETFERKQFSSLSHDPNKAMNLNSYIGLMGNSYQREEGPDGSILWPVSTDSYANFVVPDSVYLLTLDADSLLLRDYCLRLVYLLEQHENSRVAVTQTPYSAFKGAPTRIERLAGATTDIQHLLHQGLSYYGAAFWVGANAVIRKRALEDIVETETVGGFEVRRYVQDRTVIEDTESSIDLGAHGWSLINYPERLSYSATPPDFGSLIVQRRRWANGGLLILPKFLKQVRARRRSGNPISLLEFCLRLNYISSIAWANIGLLFLLIYPYDSRLLSPIVLLASLPYFITMGSDLRASGHRFTDIFRIYGFNLILLPVNLVGVLKSLQQSITGKKIPFARTPKVRNRTSAPLLFVVAPFAIAVYSGLTVWRDINAENWANAAFAGFNTVLALATIVMTIGLLNSIVDIWLGLTAWLWVPKKGPRTNTAPPHPVAPPSLNWRSVLYHGALTDHPALETAIPPSGEVTRWSHGRAHPAAPTRREIRSRSEEHS